MSTFEYSCYYKKKYQHQSNQDIKTYYHKRKNKGTNKQERLALQPVGRLKNEKALG